MLSVVLAQSGFAVLNWNLEYLDPTEMKTYKTKSSLTKTTSTNQKLNRHTTYLIVYITQVNSAFRAR